MTTDASYDEIPYPTYPRWAAHPEHLGVMGVLHGLTPAPAERCRVLEIGCGNGGHLIPLAQALPQSQFLGIDLAEQAVARGQALIGACGLGNIELRQADLATLSDPGRFDYIIAHGVYSWVPADVRDHLLRLTAACLAAHGIAFISYTVFPGAFLQRMLRNMMLFHAGSRSGRERLERAKELLAFLADTKSPPELYRQLCQNEQQKLHADGDESYHHEVLADVYGPVHFHEFMDHARKHGLQFVTDTAFANPVDRYYVPDIVARLRRLAGEDRLELEQQRDFLEGRGFRQTLLCRDGLTLSPAPRPELVADLNIQSAAQPTPTGPDLTSAAVVEFQTPVRGGQQIKTGHALSKAALCILGERWPESLPVRELIGQARQRLGMQPRAEADDDVRSLLEFVLLLNSSEFVKLHRHAPSWSRMVADRPLASPLARCQAGQGLPVVNLWHQVVSLDPVQCRLLCLLDGTRDRTALVDAMAAGDKEQPTPSARVETLEAQLREIAQLCLLIG